MFPLLPLIPSPDCCSEQQWVDKFQIVGSVLVPVDSGSVQNVQTKIKALFGSLNVNVLANQLSVDECIGLLDAGAGQVFATSTLVEDLANAGVGQSRLVVIDGADNDQTAGNYIKDAASLTKEFAVSQEKKIISGGGAKTVYFKTSDPLSASGYGPAVPVVDAEKLDKKTIGDILASRVKTDRADGLFTTLVVDTGDKCLGLVYSSIESIVEAIKTGTGVYQSRSRGLWYKGATSGATQKLLRVDVDCDNDCLKFVVDQTGEGFCHNQTATCFGQYGGLASLEKTLESRMKNAPQGSYTARLFSDEKLLRAKIMEEAEELCDAKTKDEVAWEAADLFYFAMTRIVKAGVSLKDVEANLDAKSRKISRRKGDAKPKWAEKEDQKEQDKSKTEAPKETTAAKDKSNERIEMQRVDIAKCSDQEVEKVLTRPVQKTADIMKLVLPIITDVQTRGDQALIDFTAKFEKAKLSSPVLNAPFPTDLMQVTDKVKDAIDLSFENIRKFHAAQLSDPLRVETAPGVVCSRFSRAIESVGLYVPGGTAVLPSTALMLGVPAMVAGCSNIIVATPPRSDGTPTPEVVYVAHKIGAQKIVLAGGAQAVAAMAYGTESVTKVDKIMGPGNQFVTAAKMYVQNDTKALVSIDMPAGPSEVLVVADKTANPAFVASDLLSQAEHGVDSQVILISVDLSESELKAIEDELHSQAMKLPRVDIVRGSIAHSTTLQVQNIERAMELSNKYGPEHLILHVANAPKVVDLVNNAGSVFVGPYSPESCGDYSSGTNHTLPTYGYAKMYSGVNTATFQKHITSQELTEEGLKNIGPAVMELAAVEGLDAHRNAVKIRLEQL
uniref:Histidine biosynthesis trifunctional protein n=1 Tax=Blastobotrys adeninivorans TaxID=409370 RepID=A0A060TD23_BLAAD